MLSIIADIALIVTPIVIAVGFYFAYKQWASTRNARMAELVVLITCYWNSQEMAESRRAVNECGSNLKKAWEDADKTNEISSYGSLIRVANFFDALGVQVGEGFLDIVIAYDLFGKAEKTYYRLYDPLINAREYEDYVPCFRKLHELFIKEEAHRSHVKQQRVS